jgi:hypothetical protein
MVKKNLESKGVLLELFCPLECSQPEREREREEVGEVIASSA